MNNKLQVQCIENIATISSSRFSVVSKLPVGGKMGERNYSKTSKTCYISNQQFSENFSKAH